MAIYTTCAQSAVRWSICLLLPDRIILFYPTNYNANVVLASLSIKESTKTFTNMVRIGDINLLIASGVPLGFEKL